jgi:hypothetical protein
MHRHQLVEGARHPATGQRQPHGDLQALSIPFIQHDQQAHPAPVVERFRHEVDRPGLVQHRRGRQRLPHPSGHAPGRPAAQIQSQRAVHAMHVLVIPRTSFGRHPIKELPEAHRGYRATTLRGDN